KKKHPGTMKTCDALLKRLFRESGFFRAPACLRISIAAGSRRFRRRLQNSRTLRKRTVVEKRTVRAVRLSRKTDPAAVEDHRMRELRPVRSLDEIHEIRFDLHGV